ncbi:MAG: histidinol phosphatase [Candidatus Hydrogenedentes bacterium]|nr:histidinol phosphatase [Candidatus Hydrogenedentota bacterium]
MRAFTTPVIALTLTLASCTAGFAADITGQQWPKRERSTIVRMDPEHLRAAAADAKRLNESRQPVALKTGLNDYKGILHAHAEDSSHTGGTRPEMLIDAKKTGVDVIMLSNHIRPPLDFITETWRGLHDGVLFIPGAESQRFLYYPEKSVMHRFDGSKPEDEREGELLQALEEAGGFAFLCHVESRPNYSMEGLIGQEIYNRHADAMDDIPSMMHLMRILTDTDLFAKMEPAIYENPSAFLGAQQDYQTIYINKWDTELKTMRSVGVGANDCHHNQIFIAKMFDAENVLIGTIVDKDEDMRKLPAKQVPGLEKLFEGHQPGDIVAQLNLDPYWVSFMDLSTHILAPELTETAIRQALLAGHAYVSHDWLCDPRGAAVMAKSKSQTVVLGDEIPFEEGLAIHAEFPTACHVRIIKDGVLTHEAGTRQFEYAVPGPGVYRLEAWLEIDGEFRPWIYANPIYVR